jgi:hypothetical protein
MELTFKEPAGWNVYRRDFGVGGASLPTLWASNVKFASTDLNEHPETTESTFGLPTETLSKLPGDGIVLVVMGPRPYAGGSDFPLFKPPLRLANAFRKSRAYGASSDAALFLLDRWVGDELMNVALWLGTKESASLEQLADDALGRVSLAA